MPIKRSGTGTNRRAVSSQSDRMRILAITYGLHEQKTDGRSRRWDVGFASRDGHGTGYTSKALRQSVASTCDLLTLHKALQRQRSFGPVHHILRRLTCIPMFCPTHLRKEPFVDISWHWRIKHCWPRMHKCPGVSLPRTLTTLFQGDGSACCSRPVTERGTEPFRTGARASRVRKRLDQGRTGQGRAMKQASSVHVVRC